MTEKVGDLMAKAAIFVLLGMLVLFFVCLQALCVGSCISIYKLTSEHDAMRKSRTVPEEWKPFIRPPGRSLPPLMKALLRALTVAPLKFIAIIIGVLCATAFAPYLAKNKAVWIASKGGRFVSWITGVNTITFRGKAAAPCEAPLVVANHISWLDFIVLGTTTQFGFVISEAVSRAPIVGPGFVKLARCVDSVLLQRDSAQSRAAAKTRIAEKLKQIQSHGKGERLIVFSEGTLTNGEYVVPFKVGAFEALVPVQPLRIIFSNPHFSLAGIGTVEGTALFCCLGGTEMTLEWGEVVIPSQEDTPETLALRVRSALVKGSSLMEARVGSYRDHMELDKLRRAKKHSNKNA